MVMEYARKTIDMQDGSKQDDDACGASRLVQMNIFLSQEPCLVTTQHGIDYNKYNVEQLKENREYLFVTLYYT